jgi:hypothetical protein
MSKTRVYEIWAGMKKRCLNPRNHAYPRYGGRGITVCDHWMIFENFFSDMGHPPSARHWIERIDNDRGYEPGNCSWATPTQEVRNRRSSRTACINDETMPLIEAANRLGINYSTAYWRYCIPKQKKGKSGGILRRDSPSNLKD